MLNYRKFMLVTKFNCEWQFRDKENFPHNLAKMTNWDPAIMPKWCGHWKPLLTFYVFSRPFDHESKASFVGAYTNPEICNKIERSVMRPIAVSNLTEFKQDVVRKLLPSIARSLPVKPPVDDHELTHEIIWQMIQGQISDSDNFTTLNVWDWLRSLFAKVGDVHMYRYMARGGLYKRTTILTAIKDLRDPRYAKGPTIDIKPKAGHKYFMPQGTMKRAEAEKDEKTILESWDGKMFVRVK